MKSNPENLCDVLDSMLAKHPKGQIGVVLRSGSAAEGVAEKISSDPALYRFSMTTKQRAESGQVFTARHESWVLGSEITQIKGMVRVDKSEPIKLSTGGQIPAEADIVLS